MSEMRVQDLIYPVLIHNSSTEICACIQGHTKPHDNYITVHIMPYILILVIFSIYLIIQVALSRLQMQYF